MNRGNKSTGDIAGRLERKRNLLLALVRKFPGISRQQCAQQMGISTFSTTKLVPKLVEAGMVIETESVSSGSGKGRPSTPLRLNSDYDYFAGIDIEAMYWRFMIIDFTGRTVFSRTFTFGECDSRDGYIERISHLLTCSIESCSCMWQRVSALGIGAPGFIDTETGIVESYELLRDFNRIPLFDICSLKTPKKIFINHNIANLTIHDLWMIPENALRTIMRIAIRSGISCSFNIHSQAYTGEHGRSGELGLALHNGKPLQEQASLSALQKQYGKADIAVWSGKTSAIKKEMGKRKFRLLIDEAMKAVAVSIVNMATVLDPAEVKIYSSLLNQENLVRDCLRSYVANFRKSQNLAPLLLTFPSDSEFNAAIGAALHALEKCYPC